MPLFRIDPVRRFELLARRINEMTEEAQKGFTVETGGFNPRVDIIEDAKNIYVQAELPGMKKEDVSLSVNEERVMTLKGMKNRKENVEGRSQIRAERSFGEFSRNFSLPENIDLEKIGASYENGIREVTLPKKEPEKPKEVEVKIASFN